MITDGKDRIIFSQTNAGPYLENPARRYLCQDRQKNAATANTGEQWAEDVAQIADRIRSRVDRHVGRSRQRVEPCSSQFQSFLNDLRQTLESGNKGKRPGGHDCPAPGHGAGLPGPLRRLPTFAGRNPVSRSLQAPGGSAGAEGLVNETRDLEPFYESVRNRASALDNAEGPARSVLTGPLRKLFPESAQKGRRTPRYRLHAGRSPVDFILKSADHRRSADALRTQAERPKRAPCWTPSPAPAPSSCACCKTRT